MVHGKIRIILVDEHKMMCTALRALFKSQSEMEVVGGAEDGATAIRLAHELKPDAVKAVMANEIYLCPKTTNIIVGDYIQSRSGGAALQIQH